MTIFRHRLVEFIYLFLVLGEGHKKCGFSSASKSCCQSIIGLTPLRHQDGSMDCWTNGSFSFKFLLVFLAFFFLGVMVRHSILSFVAMSMLTRTREEFQRFHGPEYVDKLHPVKLSGLL
jgi:hypothetical protein